MNVVEQISHAKFFLGVSKDVHIVVPFAYLTLPYSKFEWAENEAVQARTKKLSSKQICCTTMTNMQTELRYVNL